MENDNFKSGDVEESRPDKSRPDKDRHKESRPDESNAERMPPYRYEKIVRGEIMEKKNLEDVYRESFQQMMLTDKLILEGQDYIANMNPIDRILKPISELDPNEPLRKNAIDKLQSMMIDWLDTYADMLKEGRNLPKDLIGEAADLAKRQREKLKDE